MIPSQDAWGTNSAEEGAQGIPLPPQYDDALASLCGANGWWPETQEYLFRRMMREEAIRTADRIFRALVCEGDHAILGRVEEPKEGATREEKRLYKLSEEALAFTKGWVEALPYSLKRLSWDLLESFAFGHKLAEIEYGPYTVPSQPFKNGSYVAPVDISPKPRTVYEFRVTKSNRLVGVVIRNGTPETFVPANNLVVMTAGGMDRDQRGDPILAAIYENYASKIKHRLNQRKASDQTGGGFILSEHEYPPEGEWKSTIDVPTGKTDDQGNDILKKVSVMRVTAAELAKAATGKAASTPPGVKTKVIQASGAEIFGNFIGYDDAAVFRAFLGNAQIVMEAKRDSQAASGKAENVGETLRDDARGLLSAVLEQAFLTVLRLNHGNKYDAVAPRYDIVTEEGADFAAIVTAMMNPGFAGLPTDIKNAIASKGGFSPVFVDEEQPDETQAIDQADQNAVEEEVAAFYASFGEEDPTLVTFATRSDRANVAAQKRIGGPSGAVRSADRQFRSLVSRLADGKLTEDDFRTRFDQVLSKAHDRAYSIGFKHAGGGDVLSQAGEEYVATVTASEGSYAADLAAGLADGSVTKAQGLARARQYANRVRGTANEAFREGTLDTGQTLTWQLGGNEDHCSECPRYAELSPWEPTELPAVPADSSTPCRSNCLCKLTRSDGKEGFGPVDFVA